MLAICKIVRKSVNTSRLANTFTQNTVANQKICKVCNSNDKFKCIKYEYVVSCNTCERSINSSCSCSNARDYFGECNRYKKIMNNE